VTNSVVYMFSGQGSQYYGMAKELYKGHRGFRQTFDKLDGVASGLIGDSLAKLLYRSGGDPSEPFNQILHTHPAIFMVEYALAQALIQDGVLPCATLGCSLGEFTSAAVAGVAEVEELLEAVLVQAKTLINHCRGGSMLAIFHDAAFYQSAPILYRNSELVSINYDTHFVISGFTEKIKEIRAFLAKERILSQSLPVSYAFHSSLIDPAATPYREYLDAKKFLPPSVPFASCLTGTVTENFTGHYFWDVIRQRILFTEALRELEKDGPKIYLDLGPGGTLAGFVRRNLAPDSRSDIYAVITPYHQELKSLQKIRSITTKNYDNEKGN